MWRKWWLKWKSRVSILRKCVRFDEIDTRGKRLIYDPWKFPFDFEAKTFLIAFAINSEARRGCTEMYRGIDGLILEAAWTLRGENYHQNCFQEEFSSKWQQSEPAWNMLVLSSMKTSTTQSHRHYEHTITRKWNSWKMSKIKIGYWAHRHQLYLQLIFGSGGFSPSRYGDAHYDAIVATSNNCGVIALFFGIPFTISTRVADFFSSRDHWQ